MSQGWAEGHEFTLFMLATVLVEMVGGVDAVLINPCSVVFGQAPPGNYDGGPWTAFALKDKDVKRQDSDPSGVVASQWSPTAVVYCSMLAE